MIKSIRAYLKIVCFFLGACLFSCGEDLETIVVKRDPLVELSIEGSPEVWKSRTIRVIAGPSIIKSAGDPAQDMPFKRYFMIAEGTTPGKDHFELTIAFDAVNDGDMRHNYTAAYAVQGGLHQITLITQTSTQYTVHEICATLSSPVFFEINRQSSSEKLLGGSFNAELCETGSGDVLRISNAAFRDIYY